MNELHRLILEDKDLNSPDRRSGNSVEVSNAPIGSRDRGPPMPTLVEDVNEDSSPLKSSITDPRAKTLIDSLLEENKALKKEISAFDVEFFEQLEDLKYRYVRMQEIVGADPSLLESTLKDSKLNENGDNSGNLTRKKSPLDRLAWSAQNLSHAMEQQPAFAESKATTFQHGLDSFRENESKKNGEHILA